MLLGWHPHSAGHIFSMRAPGLGYATDDMSETGAEVLQKVLQLRHACWLNRREAGPNLAEYGQADGAESDSAQAKATPEGVKMPLYARPRVLVVQSYAVRHMICSTC